MLEPRPAELAAETPEELAAAVKIREAELVVPEAQQCEAAAAISVATDPARRVALKRRASELTEALTDVRAIISRLRAARSQSVANEELRKRGGIPFEASVWPVQRFGSERRRGARSRGVNQQSRTRPERGRQRSIMRPHDAWHAFASIRSQFPTYWPFVDAPVHVQRRVIDEALGTTAEATRPLSPAATKTESPSSERPAPSPAAVEEAVAYLNERRRELGLREQGSPVSAADLAQDIVRVWNADEAIRAEFREIEVYSAFARAMREPTFPRCRDERCGQPHR